MSREIKIFLKERGRLLKVIGIGSGSGVTLQKLSRTRKSEERKEGSRHSNIL